MAIIMPKMKAFWFLLIDFIHFGNYPKTIVDIYKNQYVVYFLVFYIMLSIISGNCLKIFTVLDSSI